MDMDPFTQRMLERARLRQEKSKLSSRNPHELLKKQSPLKENNHTLKIKTEVEVTLNTVKAKERVSSVEVMPPNGETTTAVHQNEVSKENANDECSNDKTGSSVIRDKVRSRLKRLGALYADSQLSSPIHQTEGSFSAEQDKDPFVEQVPQTQELPKLKSGRSMAKLAALANNMKEWEDDLSHPCIPSSANASTVNEHGQSQANNNLNKNTTTITQHQENRTAVPKQAKDVSLHIKEDKRPKHVIWDKTIIETLEAQGFSRTQSNSRLVYDYAKRSSQDTNTTLDKTSAKQDQHTFKQFNEEGCLSQGLRAARDDTQGSNSNKGKISPIKGNILKDSSSPRTPPTPKMGLQVISPRKSPKTGSVLHRAALFESNNSANSTAPKIPAKDPTELTILERKALFEQNKGEALIPKTAFSMPVPPKYLLDKNKNKKNISPEKENKNKKILPAPLKDETTQSSTEPTPRTGISKTIAKLFESGAATTSTSNRELVQSSQSARQKELEMLTNRWNTNKSFCSYDTEVVKDNKNETFKSSDIPPPAPPMPQMNIASTSPPLRNQHSPKQPIIGSNTSRANLQAPALQYPGVGEIKRIKVSPPKPGRLYPCLSDIEVTTETETETEMDTQDENNEHSISDRSDESIGDTSFGREILQAAGLQNSPISKSMGDASMSSDESNSEKAVFEDMDDFLDEALSDDSDSDIPTPPKKTRSASKVPKKGSSEVNKKQLDSSPSSSQSHSFKYTRGANNPELPTRVEEGNEHVPLMHTVSFYRRQQNLALKPNNVRQVVREPEPQTMDTPRNINQVSEETVRKLISDLLEEVSKQQTIISQASQALNLCCSTVEFSGSTEQVEGERLLLVATHKRQAALNEVQRLKVEGTLKPGGSNPELIEKGSLVISNITLPLKRDYLRSMAADETCYHFVCLLRAQEKVAATPAVAASSDNLRSGGGISVIFPGSLRLDGLYSDFKATVEIYSLQTRREILPHDVKYHISNKKEVGGSSSSKLRLTPKKLLKQESKLIMPSVQSPAGPSAVRTTAFQLSGYVVFSLRELRRTQFTLNKVAFTSPLEGSINLQLNSELQLEVSQKGFLTMFEDVSGFGAWHRRWCMLSGNVLSYWKYPDDENKKVPIGQIDLNTCSTETVGLVSRDICARPNTFLLETKRPSSPHEEESLVLVKQGEYTIVRHLLSADTKEDRIIWCTQINKALAMLKAWGAKNKNY